jgi:hypothetical protein
VWYWVDWVFEAEAVRDSRPLVEPDISLRSLELRCVARCDKRMLLSLGLRSASALVLSRLAAHDCL